MWGKKGIYILLLNILWQSFIYVCICHVRGVNYVLCSSRTKKKDNWFIIAC